MKQYYRHFKGNIYKVLHIAKHSETLENIVVYQAMYGERGQPLDIKQHPHGRQIQSNNPLRQHKVQGAISGSIEAIAR